MAPHAYAYRPMTALDLEIVRRWLALPHVVQWWGDPRKQFALISEDLGHPAMDQFIVTDDERPFAYLQCNDPIAWPDNGLGEQPGGTRGIDQFIDEKDMIGCGHGSALIRLFVDQLLNAGTPRTMTDPDPRNAPSGLAKKLVSTKTVLWIRATVALF